jgi:hypothetical protein
MTSSTVVASALAVAVLGLASVTTAHALPDKNSDRAGWIKASMTGKQAAFCGPVEPSKLPLGADPDFVRDQVKKQWDGAKMIEVTYDNVVTLANAICKFPGNPDLQAALMPLWQSVAKFYAFGASEIADVATVQDPQRTKIEMPTRAPKDTRLSDADPLTQALVAKELLVTSYGMDFMSYAEMLDTTPNASEQLKVAFVVQCIDSYSGSIARWAICKADATGLDRKRFDKELAGAKVDPRYRLGAKLKFVQLQAKVKARADEFAALAAKDRGVAKALDEVPAAAAKVWATESATSQAALSWTYKVVDDGRANNKRLMEGCEETLREHLGTYLKAKAPKTKDELKDVFRDNIGSQLGNAAALCFVRNEAAQKFWANQSTGFAERWGVRTMIWHALASEKLEFDTDRGNDPLGLPKPVITYANASSAASSGTVATMKENGDAFDITFKKETWKETVCKQWKETNKIDGIDLKSGKLLYRTVCVKTGTETRESTATPVKVDKAYATGLKVGVSASFARNSDGGAYPTAIYADAKRAKLVGAFGVLY